MSDSKRPLLKGPLRQPRSKPVVLSYAEPRRSRHEVTASARDGSIKVTEFNGSANPQPFLDPSIMQKRARLERERKADD